MSEYEAHNNGGHVAEIDARLRRLSAAFVDGAAMDDFEELFVIIHRPGWTTPAEIALVNGLIDAAERNVQDAVQLRSAMLQGARMIVEATAVAG
jgi:hypothetical protein